MSFIKGRLRHLEERSRGGRCQECGLRPQDNGYIVVDDNDPAGHMTREEVIRVARTFAGEEGEPGQ